MIPQPEDMAYIAGFFDGEGYISIRRTNRTTQKNPHYRIIVGFTQKDRTVLEWISAHFGGAIYKKVHKNPRAATAYELIFLNRAEVTTLLEALEPRVRIKIAQVKLALEFMGLGLVRRHMTLVRGKTWPVFSAIPEDIQVREQYKLKLTELNRRGACLLSA